MLLLPPAPEFAKLSLMSNYIDTIIHAMRATGASNPEITDKITTAILASPDASSLLRQVVSVYVATAD
jgi:hypothetical protein